MQNIKLNTATAAKVAHALAAAGETDLAKEIADKVEAALEEQREREFAKTEEGKRAEARRARRRHISELCAKWQKEVLSHCRHLNRSRMAWVLERNGNGMVWGNSNKSDMAHAIIEAMFDHYGHGSAFLKIAKVDEINAETIAAAMRPFREQRNPQGKDGLTDAERAEIAAIAA